MTRDLRQSVRKPLDAAGILSTEGVQHRIRTIDISAGGLSIMIAKQLTVRRNCHVQFELGLGETMYIVAGSCHVVYCLYSGTAYRVGLQFLSIAGEGAALIEQRITGSA